MSVSFPTRVGGFIYAFDSNSISTEIDIEGFPVGTKVWNQDVGAFFTLSLSVAALVTDEVLSVLGIVGARWVKDVAANAVNAETADAPSNAVTFQSDLIAGVATIATLGSDGNNLDVTGLSGDTDGDYEFEGVLTLAGNATQNVVSMQPENLATNQAGQFLYGSGITPATGGAGVMIISAPTNTADSVVVFRGKLSSKSGRVRIFTCVGVGVNTDASKFISSAIVPWLGTGTVLTKIRVNADHGMRAGSFIRLLRMRNVT